MHNLFSDGKQGKDIEQRVKGEQPVTTCSNRMRRVHAMKKQQEQANNYTALICV